MRPHFLATTEGLLPITALLYGFEISDPHGIGRQERLDSGRRRLPRVFPNFLDDMTLYFGIFPVFRGIFPSTFGIFR